jgi:hypothetical protein
MIVTRQLRETSNTVLVDSNAKSRSDGLTQSMGATAPPNSKVPRSCPADLRHRVFRRPAQGGRWLVALIENSAVPASIRAISAVLLLARVFFMRTNMLPSP